MGKTRKKRTNYTFINREQKKKEVVSLGSVGVSDQEITKRLNVPYSFVQKTTTEYWNKKIKHLQIK